MRELRQPPATTSADGPRVTVVVPAFNAAETIATTIACVQAQTTAAWELIVVDDGSSDETAELVTAEAETDPRIKLIRAGHHGVSAARNAGVAAARGAWILFLDADDAIAADHLAVMLDHAEADPDADVFHCGWRSSSRDGEGAPQRPQGLADPFPVTAARCPLAIHSALTRRTAVTAANGFDPSLRTCEDWDLWQKLARLGCRFSPVEGVHARYTMRDGSLGKDLDALLTCGLEVIRRGHGADPRLPRAAERWALGAPASELRRAEADYGAWIYGGALGKGEGDRFLHKVLDLFHGVDPDPLSLAVALLSGAARTTNAHARSWLEIWPRIAAGTDTFLRRLEGQSGAPRLARRTQRFLEQQMSRDLPAGAVGDLDALAIRPIELNRPLEPISLAPQTERVLCVVRRAGEELGRFELAASGELRVADYEPILREEYGVAPAAPRPAPAPPPPRQVGLAPLARRLLARVREGSSAARSKERARLPDPSDPGCWDQVFARPDPWDYGNAYERLKYRQTLASIPPGAYANAIELACAEGHFTVDLAQRVGRLTATDISPVALQRAAARCAGLDNVTFAQLDLLCDPLPGVFDLIVCSEVLYYLPDAEALRKLTARLADHLADGGVLVTTHAHIVADDPEATGYRWPHPFGAAGIGQIIAEEPRLALDRELRTELYRVQVFRKTPAGAAPPAPVVTHGPFARVLPDHVAALIQWKGGAPDIRRSRPPGLPILAYHRIAEDGPPALQAYRVSPPAFDAQMSHLRANGYSGITLEAFESALWRGAPLPPKPVLITFDDGYRDVFVNAAPILERHGFRAAIFLVADRVGQAADWDRRFGPPAALMDWDQIGRLASAGHGFGLHGRRHISLMGLSPAELDEEFALGARLLTERLGTCTSLAYPHGEHDEAVSRAALRHGFRLGFSCREGAWRHGDQVMSLPRLTVTADMDLDAFHQLLAAA